MKYSVITAYMGKIYIDRISSVNNSFFLNTFCNISTEFSTVIQ